MLTRRKLPAVVLILTGTTLVAPLQPATAQNLPVFVYGESEFTRVEHVRFGDLDLASRAGARKLESRVAGAVKRVCLFEPEIRLQPGDYHACAADSWAKARPQIDSAVARAQALALAGQPATIATAIVVAAQ